MGLRLMKKLSYIDSGAKPLFDASRLEEVAKMLGRRHATYLSGRLSGLRGAALHALSASSGAEEFRVDAGFSQLQVQLRVTLARVDGTWGYPVETVMTDETDGVFSERDLERPLKLLNLMLDFQDAYWSEYFSSGRETFVTVDWSSHSYAGSTIYVRGFERAWALEQAADQLFAEHGRGDHDIVSVSSET